MPLRAACLTHPFQRRYRLVADAMSVGIRACGDDPIIHPVHSPMLRNADVGVCWGWKRRASYIDYPTFIYADLGYWQRETHYRMVVGGWSPERYVRAGLPDHRLETLGVNIKRVKKGGDTIIIAGSTMKSCIAHGVEYRAWEIEAAEILKGCGKRVVYRPKPLDKAKKPIPFAEYDDGPLESTLARACGLVTHHSNASIDALVEGIPVHCVTGAAAAFSVPLLEIGSADMPEGREQFLADVSWLNWSLEEMRSGEPWVHMKGRGLLC